MKIAFLFSMVLGMSAFAAEKGTYKIDGMTCGSCVKMIKSKVCQMEGVKSCEVKIGEMVLTSDAKLDEAKIKEAVTSAGDYKVTDVKVEAAK